MAELRGGLLAEPDGAGRLALDEDGEHTGVVLGRRPPQGDLRLPDGPVEEVGAGGDGGAQDDPLPARQRPAVPLATQSARWSSTRPHACMSA
ncbi:hypothetical protein Srut_00940 [Streptomyces rutgersensis]|nr:hypothetical protein Srut_00940 [Streptomyces rutgersensis]